jgi:hypothetical protein
VTRLCLIAAALFASACSFHTHETVIVQPGQPRPVYAVAPRDPVAPRHHPRERRTGRARPGKPQPGGVAARPDPKPPGAVGARPKPHPRPYVDRRKSPRRVVLCTRETQKHRKECAQKSNKS